MKTKETLKLISNEIPEIDHAVEAKETELFNPNPVFLEIGRRAVLDQIDARLDPVKAVKYENYSGPQGFNNAVAGARFRAEREARHPEKLASLKLAREAIQDPHAEKLPVSYRGETEPTAINVYHIPQTNVLDGEDRFSA